MSPGGLSRALVSVHPSLGFLIVLCLWITADRSAKMKSLCSQFYQGCGEAKSFPWWYSAPGKYFHSAWISASKHAEVVCVHPGNFGERGRGTKETSHALAVHKTSNYQLSAALMKVAQQLSQQNYQWAWVVVSHQWVPCCHSTNAGEQFGDSWRCGICVWVKNTRNFLEGGLWAPQGK